MTDRLDKIEPSLKFTHELETNNSLPFLHNLLIRNNDKLKFKLFHKSTCKNDHKHFYSHHNTNTKEELLKLFFYLGPPVSVLLIIKMMNLIM